MEISTFFGATAARAATPGTPLFRNRSSASRSQIAWQVRRADDLAQSAGVAGGCAFPFRNQRRETIAKHLEMFGQPRNVADEHSLIKNHQADLKVKGLTPVHAASTLMGTCTSTIDDRISFIIFTGVPLSPAEEESVRQHDGHVFYKPQPYAVLINQLNDLLKERTA